MKLFGGPVAWRANKQDTVTTSSTEAELLAISQTAKEPIYLSRLMKALTRDVPEPLTIECDNTQTIRLLVDESTKLQTKLRHVDIHSHWLRQEVQRGSIAVRWVPTKQMMADGLIKALTHANHEDFVGMTGLEDQSSLLGVLILPASICYHSDLRILELTPKRDNCFIGLTPRSCLVATAFATAFGTASTYSCF